MLRLRTVGALVRRHRRLTALLGSIMVLGVVGLNAHAALPEHHDLHDSATVCIAGLAIATLAAVGSLARQPSLPSMRPLACCVGTGCSRDITMPAPPGRSRDGPPGPVPLRR